MLFNTINDLTPSSHLAQAASIAQNVSAIFVLTIFASIIIASRSEKQKSELDQTIRVAEREGEAIEAVLKERYKWTTIETVVRELQRLKASSISVIAYLTTQLEC